MRDTYLVNGIERKRNACENEVYKIRDTETGDLLYRTRDENDLSRKMNELKARGYLLTIE